MARAKTRSAVPDLSPEVRENLRGIVRGWVRHNWFVNWAVGRSSTAAVHRNDGWMNRPPMDTKVIVVDARYYRVVPRRLASRPRRGRKLNGRD